MQLGKFPGNRMRKPQFRFTRNDLEMHHDIQCHLWGNALLKITLRVFLLYQIAHGEKRWKRWATGNVSKQQKDPGQFQTYYGRTTLTAQKLLFQILFYTLLSFSMNWK